MFFFGKKDKKEEESQLSIRNREKFDDSNLREADKIETEETVEEQHVEPEQVVQEESVESEVREEMVEQNRDQVISEQPLQQENVEQATRVEEHDEPETEIIQSKQGNVKVKRNWDAYSLPSYMKDEEDTQLSMEIKKTPSERYYNIKRRLVKLDTVLEIMPYWKSFLTMFTLVFSIFSILAVSYLIVSNFGSLKNEIPLFYDHQQGNSISLNKSVLLSVPIAAFFFNLLIIRLSMMVYNFDRKLVYSVNVALVLFNLLLLIAVIQVISLVLF